MPRLPLWYMLRGVVWMAVLVWTMVMVGKQVIIPSNGPLIGGIMWKVSSRCWLQLVLVFGCLGK